MTCSFEPIGVIRSCFQQKFGIPRQPGLVPEARAVLELFPPYNRMESLRGLEGFSHLWVIFVFHECKADASKTTVRPPRLGGNRRVGVFATRSGFRPNPIGMSAVEMEKIEDDGNGVRIHLKGVDLLDGTPVLDIKPYLPYADRIIEATGGFAARAPEKKFTVSFALQALEACRRIEAENGICLEPLVSGMLSYDPRPAYYNQNSSKSDFAACVCGFEVRWKICGDQAVVQSIEGPEVEAG